jgi:hypothetical protein
VRKGISSTINRRRSLSDVGLLCFLLFRGETQIQPRPSPVAGEAPRQSLPLGGLLVAKKKAAKKKTAKKAAKKKAAKKK